LIDHIILRYLLCNQCVITGCCRLPRVLDQALTAFLAVLNQHTLASIALKPKDFRAVLQTARRPKA
jgi:Rrf2 family nitric oxide-sensitive transcriptional repressor